MIKIKEDRVVGRYAINETSLSRLLGKHYNDGFITISACRGTITKDGSNVKVVNIGNISEYYLVENNKATNIKLDERELMSGQELRTENNRRTKELESQIISKGYSFLPVLGGWIEDGGEVFEKSFMIFAFDRKGNPIDINDVIKDCKKWSVDYWQDCILINDTTSSPYLWYRDDGEEEKVNSRKINDLLKATFTALKPYDKKKGSPQRFTLETVHQPESICMARQRRMKNGEICLTIYSWENGKG